jgi:hypothetical protein
MGKRTLPDLIENSLIVIRSLSIVICPNAKRPSRSAIMVTFEGVLESSSLPAL